MVNYRNQKVTVVGLGKSGLAAARRLQQLGAKVFVTEAKAKADLINDLASLGIEVEFGGHTDEAIKGAAAVIVSPGVPLNLPILQQARAEKIPVIAEIELAYQLLTKPLIAVTGTNGKTTTTTLIGELLTAGGKKVAVAGNIGEPLVEVEDQELDFVVAEISSYQLEAITTFQPWISIFLNLQPDHLERHHTLAEYLKQKSRIFVNQQGDDYLVYNGDDPQVCAAVKTAKAQLVPFSKAQAQEIITLKPEEIKLPGRHNLENVLAAAQVAKLCGISSDVVAQVLKSFSGVEHRIEYVTAVNGVEFRNDSKGTNPDSTLVAIETFAGRGIVLILGGRDKGVDLAPLAQAIKAKVKGVVLLGEAAPKLTTALQAVGYQPITQAGFSLETAVNQAFQQAVPGDVVLFSPACASFDMFRNYEERGQIFKELCQNLSR